MRLLSLASLVLTLAAAPALADSEGPLRVVDADTFDVGGVRVRLFGVDAPEAAQTCLDATGSDWACGAWATDSVRRAWEGATATCVRVDTDRYGREVARCSVAGEDLGAALVRQGLAIAYRDYSTDYVADEDAARLDAAGLWAGEFQAPADWRSDDATATLDDAAPAPEGCAIKGNVSGSGRIYHLPGSRDYDRTVIDEGRGERWFCSEGEALAAGWRAPRG